MKLAFWVKVIAVVLVGFLVVFVVDPLDRTTVSTPFLLGIILMGLSLRQSTILVVVASFAYTALTIFALITFRQYIDTTVHVSPHPGFWLFQRAGLFLVLCGLAIYLAHYRTDTQRVLSHMQGILSKLPAPVVVSDAGGFISYANEALCDTFSQEASELSGKRYVEYFMTDIQEGKAMRYYIELFEGQDSDVHEVEIKPFDSESKIKARVTCLGSGPNRIMITVFNDLIPKF